MGRWVGAVCLAVCFGICWAAPLVAASSEKTFLPPGDRSTFEIVFDGVNRTFTLYTPTTVNPNVLSPLVFAIHFLGAQPTMFAAYTLFDQVAEENQFIVVYPAGTGRSFNAGPLCCGDTSRDDVGFILRVLAEVQRLRRIDMTRVYSTGQSNGAYMSYRLACDASNVFAAIAPVSGTSPWQLRNFLDNCKPTRPMNIFALHGTEDNLVPYEDDVQTIQYWLQLNKCSTTSQQTLFNGTTTCEAWTVNCTPQSNGVRTNVTLCTTEGGRHIYWPGSPLAIPRNYDLDTTREIWKFFTRYSL